MLTNKLVTYIVYFCYSSSCIPNQIFAQSSLPLLVRLSFRPGVPTFRPATFRRSCSGPTSPTFLLLTFTFSASCKSFRRNTYPTAHKC
jgi:hypothetical protein